jgi:transcriptional regulator with XRE-family HTH domain
MGEWGRQGVGKREVDLGAELRRWRQKRGVSLRAMGKILHCDHSRVWKIESGRLPLTREVAELCDAALRTGGALVAAWVAGQVGTRPAQLPPAPARLVGREAELAALTAGVRDRPSGTPAVVAIDGPAGVGKTALALRWSHGVAGEYVDGQLYADLRGFAPSECRPQRMVHAVLGEFLSALGVGELPPSFDERAALFRSLLAERRMLVVLDNVAGLDDIDPLLPGSAGCAVVVTSRRALFGLVGRVGATRVHLAPLTEVDAVALITDMIGEGRVDAEPAAVTDLARLCGRLPVALHAAAEAIAVYPHRQVSDVVREWAEDDHLVEIGEPTDLATLFSWSYRCLDPDARRLLRLMGLWPGMHLHVAGVAALAGGTMPFARRLLHSLAVVHLITVDCDGLVRLPDPLPAYAHTLVTTEDTDADRAAAAQRLVTWYVHHVAAAHRQLAPNRTVAGDEPPPLEGAPSLSFPDRGSAAAWCATEDVNFEPAIGLALDYGPPHAAAQLLDGVAAVRQLTRPDAGTNTPADVGGWSGTGMFDHGHSGADDHGDQSGHDVQQQASTPLTAQPTAAEPEIVLQDQRAAEDRDDRGDDYGDGSGFDDTCVGFGGGGRQGGPPWMRCGWQGPDLAPWDGLSDGPPGPGAWMWFTFLRDLARHLTDEPDTQACTQQCCGTPRDPSGACTCAAVDPVTVGSTSDTP